jgi:hypothetical protein
MSDDMADGAFEYWLAQSRRARSEAAQQLWAIRRANPAMARLLARRLRQARAAAIAAFWDEPPENGKDGLVGLIG